MGKHSDFKGYYRTLCVTSSNSSEDIRRAYRKLAKELHPDLHPNDPAATAKFQELNEAYEVLSNPESRASYDVACITAETQDTSTQHIGPVACCSCGAVSAQPRYVIFSYVISAIVITSRRTIQGVFCASCAAKRAAKASAITWLIGWWGIPWGPIWTVKALFQNLAGGIKPATPNAQILANQAAYFWNSGRHDLAASTIDQALRFDIPARLRENLSKLRQSMPSSPKGSLIDRWKLQRSWGFWAQLAPVLMILAFFTWYGRSNIIAATATQNLAHVGQVKSQILARPEPDASVLATARPFENFHVLMGKGSNGYERVLTDNGTIGYIPKTSVTYGDGTAELMNRCFPNGSSHISNGTVFRQTRIGSHKFKVTNGLSSDAVVKLRDLAGSTAISFFVATNNEVTIHNVPDGTFVIEFATGERFSSVCGYFLQNMSAQRFVNAETFTTLIKGNHRYISTLEISLNPIAGGTARTIATDESTFDQD